MNIKKKLRGLLGALSLSLVLVGCGSSSLTESITYDTAAVTESYMASDSVSSYNSMSYEATGETSRTDSSTTNVVDTDRKLIKTVNMSVETENFDVLTDNVRAKVEELGGYVESYTVSGRNSDRYCSITARVPKEQLDTFLTTVEGETNVTYKQENIEDVTLQYVDMDARKKMLEAEETRLMELMEAAQTVEDIIAVESQLTEVQYQLESIESQLRVLDNQIDYSTVYLDISEVQYYTPQEDTSIGERITQGFYESLNDVICDIQDFGIWFVINIPYIVVWIVVIIVIMIIFSAINSHRKRRREIKREKAQRKAEMKAQAKAEKMAAKEAKKQAKMENRKGMFSKKKTAETMTAASGDAMQMQNNPYNTASNETAMAQNNPYNTASNETTMAQSNPYNVMPNENDNQNNNQ